jgi:hypothetical protein
VRELAEAPAAERSLEREWPKSRTQHAAHLCTLTLQKLAHRAATRTLDGDLVPAVGPLTTGWFAALDGELRAAVELATEYSPNLRVVKLAAHPHAELARKSVHGALQPRGELAIGSEELESSIRTWHGTYCDETPAEAPRHASGHCGALRLPGR